MANPVTPDGEDSPDVIDGTFEGGPWTEIEIHAYNIHKLPEAKAKKIAERIADELRAAIWDDQDPYDRDEEEEFADFDVHTTAKVFT